MGAKAVLRAGGCLVALAVASGCSTVRSALPKRFSADKSAVAEPDKSSTTPTDTPKSAPPPALPPVPAPAAPPSGPLVPAGGVAPPTVAVPAVPTVLPPGDPHARPFPTAAGGLLNLAPGEQPLDKLIEVVRQSEAVAGQNAILRARLKELEATAVTRDQAVAEAVRQTDAATAEAAQARADLQAAQAAAAALRSRLAQVEREDVALLRALVVALEKLVPPADSPRLP